MVADSARTDSSKGSDTERLRFTTGFPAPTIVAGEGCELITADGRRILDAAGGAVVNNIGHGRREVAAAVAACLERTDYVLPVWPTPTRLELIEYLTQQWLPPGFERVFFAGGGSEANDSALRLARSYHLARGDEQRYKVIGRVPSYHGSTLATLSIGGHMARRDGFDPLLQEHPKVRWDNADALAATIEAANPSTVAAFIAEPVIGASGAALLAPLDYWATVSEVCREYGVLMIADEVMTGFGRTGQRWGHYHDDWEPDIIVAAKGISGGYLPLSMVSATNHVVDTVAAAERNVMYFTYSGHDACCAAALDGASHCRRRGPDRAGASAGCPNACSAERRRRRSSKRRGGERSRADVGGRTAGPRVRPRGRGGAQSRCMDLSGWIWAVGQRWASLCPADDRDRRADRSNSTRDR